MLAFLAGRFERLLLGEGNADASARLRTSTPRTCRGVTLAMLSTTIGARSIPWGSRGSPT
jgi:hypothetical protein